MLFQIRKFFLVAASLIILTILLLIIVYQHIYFLPLNEDVKEEKTFLVKKGQSITEVAMNLQREGFIGNRFYFLIYSLLNPKSKKIQPGQYQLSPAMTMAQILEAITKIQKEPLLFTIQAGWTLNDIGYALEKQNIFSKKNFLDAAQNPSEAILKEFDFLKKGKSLEGYLFPDSYFINKAEPLDNFLKKVLKNFQNKILTLSSSWQPDFILLENLKVKLDDVIIMASIIEKEAQKKEDREIISGIFWKRVKFGLPLQSDATIHYLNNSSLISSLDFNIDSRYNTYKYIGLPPGPISNPSIDSIKAALNPQENDFWFFLSDKDGNIHFSKTYLEHLIKKEKFY